MKSNILKESYIKFSPEVAEAINHRKPIVALESTIISHGMPFPQNIYTAQKLENIVSSLGAVPATICLTGGYIKVGLDMTEIEILAKSEQVKKVSKRDIARVLARGETGSTTVSATLKIASLCGIKVFATGGIGGVHRDADQTFDISHDLMALASYPVILVSAGAKAILDLPKTLEMLETAGVPVLGYQTDRFPAFYSAYTDLKIEKVICIDEIIKSYKIDRVLANNNGILVANPIPEKFEIPQKVMENYIDCALQSARKEDIKGKELTPFLLAQINELSAGESLKANIHLVENNAKLASQIALRI